MLLASNMLCLRLTSHAQHVLSQRKLVYLPVFTQSVVKFCRYPSNIVYEATFKMLLMTFIEFIIKRTEYMYFSILRLLCLIPNRIDR